MIFIFCAPSGSGKSTMVKHLLTTFPNTFELSISCTTRAPRGEEIDGREYYFITPEAFRQRIEQNAFIEYEQVYEGLYYGTLHSEIARIEGNGHHVIFDVDVKGGIHLKRLFGNRATSIFICPPSVECLRERLIGRGDTSPEMIEKRVSKAERELEDKEHFDHIIINDDVHQAFSDLDSLIRHTLNH